MHVFTEDKNYLITEKNCSTHNKRVFGKKMNRIINNLFFIKKKEKLYTTENYLNFLTR